MRIPKAFGKRSTADEKELEPKVKYFLAFEGEETEPQYFFGVLQNKNVLGIHALVEIVPLKRHYEEILNEQHFCEDLTELKTNLGSNVGLLIKELKK
jgi:hypothetical protein